MVRLTRRLLALLLHILVISQVHGQYPRRRGPSWSPIPPVAYQTQQDIALDRFEVRLSRLRNIYLAGFNHEIYKLMDDAAKESVRNEIRVNFYLWTHHGFKFITTLHTEYETLKRNINKYHHYFQLKKVYIERFTNKREWRIDKLIMLPSTFSDDIVFKKYGHAGDLIAAVEDPSTVILPEEYVKDYPDAENQTCPELEFKDKETDVLLDIYKKITGNKEKRKKQKEKEDDKNYIPGTESHSTHGYRHLSEETEQALQGIYHQSQEPKTSDRISVYESADTIENLTYYEGKTVQNRHTIIADPETQTTRNISPVSFSEYTTKINPCLATVSPSTSYLTVQNESNLNVAAITADIHPYSYYNANAASSISIDQYNEIDQEKKQ